MDGDIDLGLLNPFNFSYFNLVQFHQFLVLICSIPAEDQIFIISCLLNLFTYFPGINVCSCCLVILFAAICKF